MGKMGAGKTLSMTILSSYLARATGAPLYANYGLKNSEKVESLNEAVEKDKAILNLDEIWLSADSRAWKDNVRLTQWVNQTRKKQMIVFYTTQHIRQVEMRIRNGTDILIYCEKKPDGIWLNFIDWQYKKLGKRFLIENPSRFYPLYDTYEVLKPLNWDSKKKGYSNNSYGAQRYNQRNY